MVLPSQQTVVKNETVIESSEQSEKEFKKDDVVLEPVIPVKEEKSEEFLTSQALNTDSEIPNFLLAKKKKRLLISGLFLALAIIGVAVWYFSHSENVNDNPVVQTVPINQSVQPENYTNTTKEYHPNGVENTSKPEVQESDNSKLKINVETNLSQADNEIISSLIHRHTFDFDIAVNPTEYKNMMGDYENVVAKYYSKINISKTIIEEDNKKYFAEVIRKARWILNTEKSKITKNQNGYFDVDLYGEYFFYYSYNSKKHDPEIEKQLQLHNHFILNNEYKIIEQYEMERQ